MNRQVGQDLVLQQIQNTLSQLTAAVQQLQMANGSVQLDATGSGAMTERLASGLIIAQPASPSATARRDDAAQLNLRAKASQVLSMTRVRSLQTPRSPVNQALQPK